MVPGTILQEGLWNPFFLYFIDSIMVISETIKCSKRLRIYSGNNSERNKRKLYYKSILSIYNCSYFLTDV